VRCWWLVGVRLHRCGRSSGKRLSPFCSDHRRRGVYSVFAVPILTLATLNALTGWVPFEGVYRHFFPAPAAASPPATANDCIARERQRPTAVWFVNEWYCQTEFANIWSRPPDMFRANAPLLVKAFPSLGPLSTAPRPSLTKLGVQLTQSITVGQFFEDFSAYSKNFVIMAGRPHRIEIFNNAVGSTRDDWVVQLSTDQPGFEGNLVYVRFTAPSGWAFPPDCRIVAIPVLPVASGAVGSPGAPKLFQAIYTIGEGPPVCTESANGPIPSAGPEMLKVF
jgi:hypothetical protein